MEYTKKVLNKFFGLVRKDKHYYNFFKENLNGIVLTLRHIHIITWRLVYNYGDYNDVYKKLYENIINDILLPHWIKCLNEFLEILDIKTDVERFCLANYGSSDINHILSKTIDSKIKWDDLMGLYFLIDMEEYDVILDLWFSYSCRGFRYEIKIKKKIRLWH